MSWQASEHVRQLRGITAAEKVVLFALADRHNVDDNGCWPRVRLLAEDAGVSESTAHRSLRKLERAGILRIEPRKRDDGSSSSNFYQFVGLKATGQGAMMTPPPVKVTPLESSSEPVSQDDDRSAQIADQVINSENQTPQEIYEALLKKHNLSSSVHNPDSYWRKWGEKPLGVNDWAMVDNVIQATQKLFPAVSRTLPTPSYLQHMEAVGHKMNTATVPVAYWALRSVQMAHPEQDLLCLLGTQRDELLTALDREIGYDPGDEHE